MVYLYQITGGHVQEYGHFIATAVRTPNLACTVGVCKDVGNKME